MARHLSTKQLTTWLNGGSEEDHDEHIDSCSKCAARVESISTGLDNVIPISEAFRPALLAVLQPPADLHERISERIAERLQSQSDVDLFGSMFGVPAEVAQVIGNSNSETD